MAPVQLEYRFSKWCTAAELSMPGRGRKPPGRPNAASIPVNTLQPKTSGHTPAVEKLVFLLFPVGENMRHREPQHLHERILERAAERLHLGGLVLCTRWNLNLGQGGLLTPNEREFLSRWKSAGKKEFIKRRVVMGGSGLEAYESREVPREERELAQPLGLRKSALPAPAARVAWCAVVRGLASTSPGFGGPTGHGMEWDYVLRTSSRREIFWRLLQLQLPLGHLC